MLPSETAAGASEARVCAGTCDGDVPRVEGVDGAGSDVGEGLEERLAEGKANSFLWLLQGCLPSQKGFEVLQGRLWMTGAG